MTTDKFRHSHTADERLKTGNSLASFQTRTFEKLRYADTDLVGHVNNAVFSTMFETGRVELLDPLLDKNAMWVIANITIDYLAEIKWPGTVDIGTSLESIGSSSVKLRQGLFQDCIQTARASSVIVQIDIVTRKSLPLTDSAISELNLLSDSKSN